ncbi:MAG: hypothetical protein ABL936_00190 [Aestuariivirga sp.]
MPRDSDKGKAKALGDKKAGLWTPPLVPAAIVERLVLVELSGRASDRG